MDAEECAQLDYLPWQDAGPMQDPDSKRRARLVVAHTALTLLRRKDFRSTLEGTNTDGEHVIIPALPGDRMGYFFDQLRVADGPIYVAVLEGDGVVILAMAPRRAPKHAVPEQEEAFPAIHRDTEILMVLDYLRAQRGPITCFEVAPVVLVELVGDTQVGI